MNKSEFIKVYAKNAGLKKNEASKNVNCLLKTVEEVLLEEDKLSFVGFGNFEVRHRKGRVGRNPRKPEEKVEIPARYSPVFTAGKNLKENVDESRK